MAIKIEELYKILEKQFPHATIHIEDLVGDGDHYSLSISSEVFRGKTLVEQHRMVNIALKSCLGDKLHALQINTKPR